ncbi:AAA domain-containing protein [Primorskyibacter flagellatus]|uniref:AAA domain-containing protein n=2 Tax=Primorskyibacter flagellatus TaxID=1387277 RepID=A0A1W2BV76_9RHOB|nr:AAA domain-containing protein [Primorskyibacter flagellatus]
MKQAFSENLIALYDGPIRTAKALESMALGDLDGDDRDAVQRRRDQLQKALFRQCEVHSVELGDDLFNMTAASVQKAGLSHLMQQFDVRDRDATHRLLRAAALADDWGNALTNNRRNLEQFFVGSRALVCGTCVGLGDGKLNIKGRRFDLVVIDEAARATAGELMVAMQSAHRVLLVGDQKQLLPQIPREVLDHVSRTIQIDENFILESDFARAFRSEYGRKVARSLKTQYRMAPKIGDLVSKIFYSDVGLETGRSAPPEIYRSLKWPFDEEVTWVDVGGASAREMRKGTSYTNESEADAIVQCLEELSRDSVFLDEVVRTLREEEPLVGVICMYGAQRDLLANRIASSGISERLMRRVKIGTVDSYQGKENRIILLSLVRSNEFGQSGFVDNENRINVALSRAMERLVIFGSSDMFRSGKSKLSDTFRLIEMDGRVHGLPNTSLAAE